VGAGWAVEQLRPSPRPLGGELVGASRGVGHLLRDPVALPAPSGPPERCDVAIVGGGVAGLSAAWRLAGSGLAVRQLELEPFLGGTSAWGEDGAVPHPWGAHYLPAPNVEARAALRLLDDIGVLTGWDAAGRPRFDARVLCHAPQERIFHRGAWHPGLVPESLERRDREQLARFQRETEALTTRRGRDGRFAFQIPLVESSADPDLVALDGVSMARWLDDHGFDAPFVRWWVRYATLDDFGAEPEDVSAWAGLHYFAARKLETPQLEGSHYLVWPEGNGRLVRALLERSDAERTTSALALAVTPSATAGGEIAYFDVARREVRRLAARAVVLATPAFVTRRIVPAPLAAALPQRASSPWMVANLHVTRERPADHPWDSVLHDAVGLGYVDASHQLTPPRNRTVLTYFRAWGAPDVAASRRALEAASFVDLVDGVFDDLRPAHPDLRAQTERVDVVVWGHAMPRPRPGFLGARPFAAAPTERAQLAVGIAWGHADTMGMALFEESQAAGVRAAEVACSGAGIDLGETWT
jgi:glycine/D-amino acid oxidase-like deaminating enzyme